MSEKENKLKEQIERQRERQREIDNREQANESISDDKSGNFSRDDITKMQSPDKWPSPPSESEGSDED